MFKFAIAAAVLAMAAPSSEACIGQRLAARSTVKTKTVAKVRTASAPVRTVLVAPVRVVGLLIPFAGCK